MAGISRAIYYYHMKQQDAKDKYSVVKRHIVTTFNRHQGRYGYRRITADLHRQGIPVNHKTVYRLMKELHLVCAVRMKKYRSYKGMVGKIAPNLLKRDFTADRPNQKWVTDVTEIHLHGHKIYFSAILDLFNGEIVSYSIYERPVFSMVESMLKKALDKIPDSIDLILHSDQGWHYQMPQYRSLLAEKRVLQSMSRKGNCLDNAMAENFFGQMKSELLYLRFFESKDEFINELHQYVKYYNQDRIRKKLGYLSPTEYREMFLQSA
jgi:putative transposase